LGLSFGNLQLPRSLERGEDSNSIRALAQLISTKKRYQIMYGQPSESMLETVELILTTRLVIIRRKHS
jgi:hypothetical protein